jgi:hypothetical protein
MILNPKRILLCFIPFVLAVVLALAVGIGRHPQFAHADSTPLPNGWNTLYTKVWPTDGFHGYQLTSIVTGFYSNDGCGGFCGVYHLEIDVTLPSPNANVDTLTSSIFPISNFPTVSKSFDLASSTGPVEKFFESSGVLDSCIQIGVGLVESTWQQTLRDTTTVCGH